MPYHFSYELKELIISIFKKDPFERPNIDKLIKHPWFNQKNQGSIQEMNDGILLSRIKIL